MNEAIATMQAQEKLQEVEQLVGTLAGAENQLEAGYAKLAYLLRDVSENRYWDGFYESFGDYLDSLKSKYSLGKTSLRNYFYAAKDLGDDVTKEQLNEMGISKALALRQAKNSLGTLPPSLLTAALDPKTGAKDIKRLLYESTGEPEPGTWFDLDFSCFVTTEEKQEIQDAMKAARRIDPPINEDLKPSQQYKEVLLRFAREFLAAYGGE